MSIKKSYVSNHWIRSVVSYKTNIESCGIKAKVIVIYLLPIQCQSKVDFCSLPLTNIYLKILIWLKSNHLNHFLSLLKTLIAFNIIWNLFDSIMPKVNEDNLSLVIHKKGDLRLEQTPIPKIGPNGNSVIFWLLFIWMNYKWIQIFRCFVQNSFVWNLWNWYSLLGRWIYE